MKKRILPIIIIILACIALFILLFRQKASEKPQSIPVESGLLPQDVSPTFAPESTLPAAPQATALNLPESSDRGVLDKDPVDMTEEEAAQYNALQSRAEQSDAKMDTDEENEDFDE